MWDRHHRCRHKLPHLNILRLIVTVINYKKVLAHIGYRSEGFPAFIHGLISIKASLWYMRQFFQWLEYSLIPFRMLIPQLWARAHECTPKGWTSPPCWTNPSFFPPTLKVRKPLAPQSDFSLLTWTAAAHRKSQSYTFPDTAWTTVDGCGRRAILDWDQESKRNSCLGELLSFKSVSAEGE